MKKTVKKVVKSSVELLLAEDSGITELYFVVNDETSDEIEEKYRKIGKYILKKFPENIGDKFFERFGESCWGDEFKANTEVFDGVCYDLSIPMKTNAGSYRIIGVINEMPFGVNSDNPEHNEYKYFDGFMLVDLSHVDFMK